MGKQLVGADRKNGAQDTVATSAYVDQGYGEPDRLERLWAPYRSRSNFMTVIGGTKVLPHLLRDTRELLADEWHALVADETACGQQGGDRTDA